MQTAALDGLRHYLERRADHGRGFRSVRGDRHALIKEIGLGLSVAIALDATLVRLILVPATMEIMGRWYWWLARPLARVLPRADFEASERVPALA